MARSRRRYNRSTTQRIAGLVALGLPSPVQRVADSRLGSLLMLIFIPALIISGILTVKWENGAPQFSFNARKASELKDKAKQEIDSIRGSGTSQKWEQAAENLWQYSQQAGVVPNSSNNQGWPASSSQGNNWGQGNSWPQGNTAASNGTSATTGGRAPFPSTSPSAANNNASQYTGFQQQYQQPIYQQPTYQQQYQQPVYQQQQQYQQPAYQQPSYQQPLYQQPTYQQPTYQQYNQPQNYNASSFPPPGYAGNGQQPAGYPAGYQQPSGWVPTGTSGSSTVPPPSSSSTLRGAYIPGAPNPARY